LLRCWLLSCYGYNCFGQPGWSLLLDAEPGLVPADAELDDDWAVEAGRDAEDKYFEDG
jgi:hypothetical protein